MSYSPLPRVGPLSAQCNKCHSGFHDPAKTMWSLSHGPAATVATAHSGSACAVQDRRVETRAGSGILQVRSVVLLQTPRSKGHSSFTKSPGRYLVSMGFECSSSRTLCSGTQVHGSTFPMAAAEPEALTPLCLKTLEAVGVKRSHRKIMRNWAGV